MQIDHHAWCLPAMGWAQPVNFLSNADNKLQTKWNLLTDQNTHNLNHSNGESKS